MMGSVQEPRHYPQRPATTTAGSAASERPAGGQVHLAHVGVGIALHAGDLAIAPLLPLADRVLPVPDVVQALVLPRQTQVIALAHVQVDARDGAARVLRRHGGALLEVHHERAGAVLVGLLGQHAEAVVAAVAVHLADRRYQVVQVRLGTAEHRIVGGAVPASALLPALALVADHPGGDHMFPFDATGALGILAGLVAAAVQVHPVALVAAAAIELHWPFGIQLPGDLLGFGEGPWRVGEGRV